MVQKDAEVNIRAIDNDNDIMSAIIRKNKCHSRNPCSAKAKYIRAAQIHKYQVCDREFDSPLSGE